MQFWGVQKTKTKKTLQLGSNRHHHHLSTGLLSSKKTHQHRILCLLALCSSSWCWSSHLGLRSCQLLWPQAKAKIHHCLGEGPTVEAKALSGWWVSLGWWDDKKDPGTLSRPPYMKISKCATWWLNEQQDLEGKSGTHQRRLGKSHANPAPQCTASVLSEMISRKLLSQVNTFETPQLQLAEPNAGLFNSCTAS